MKKSKTLAVMLAGVIILSGCSKQKSNNSDSLNSSNSSDTSEIVLKPETLTTISLGNQILQNSMKVVATSANTHAASTMVQSKDGDFYLCQPMYNLTEDTKLDFNSDSDVKIYGKFCEDYISAHYVSIYDAQELTGKVLKLSDLRQDVDKDLALYNFLTVIVEKSGTKTTYVVPFTMKGELDIPSVAIDASEGTAYFSSAVELITVGDSTYSTLDDDFVDIPFTDFNSAFIQQEFNEELIETESFISSPSYVPQNSTLNLRKIATSSYTTVIYRAVDKNTRQYSAWGVINLGDYANAIVSSVEVPNVTGVCGQATSIDEWLALIPSQGTAITANETQFNVPVTYTDVNGDIDKLGNSLVKPGDTVINGHTIDTWMLEVGVGAQSTMGRAIFNGGSFTLFAFPKSFSEEDCKTALNRLVKRQETLTNTWKANITKTMGLIQPAVYGAVIHSETTECSVGNLLGVSSSPIEDSSSDTDIVSSQSEPTSEASSSPSSEVFSSSSNVESNLPVQSDEDVEIQDVLNKELENYTPNKGYITIPLSYGPVRFNGEDLGQVMTALYMFDGISEFEIPLGYFNLDNYDTAYGSALSIVPDIVSTQNPMLPYVAECSIDISEDGKNAIFSVNYASDIDTIKDWQPLEYVAAKQIADKISNTEYSSPADMYLAINNELCSKAEYNFDAIEQVTYRTDIISKSEEIQYAWAPYGVLCKGLGVCYSYAQSFKLICDMLDLPCLNVTGTLSGGGHIWNKVPIDNNWYIVDATNNDTTETNDIWKNTFCLVPDFILKDLLCESESFYFTSVNDNEEIEGTVNDKDCWSGDSIKRNDLKDYIKANYVKGKDFAVRVNENLEDFTPEELIRSWSDLVVEMYKDREIDISENAMLYYAGNIFYIIEG